jgi:glycosyltransferase involved in cell wall biosynthesis
MPAYNEEGNIEISLKAADEIANQISEKYEILLVDDGSTDQTVNIAKKLQAHNPNIKIVQHESNWGYGAALQTGIKNCQYEYIFFTDADLQFDFLELRSFLPQLSNFDVIIGYRLKRQDPFIRLLNAKLWNLLVRIFFSFES